MMDKNTRDIILGLKPAKLVLKNASVIHVHDGTIERADIAIHNGKIAGIGDYTGLKEVDCKGRFVAPGFIDGHVHIESSMVTPSRYARLVLPYGTTSVIADPHEIANVCGVEGLRFMLEDAKRAKLEIHFMIPSCVPATPFETAGGRISVQDIQAWKHQKGILGLGEVMDYPSVLTLEPTMMAKLKAMKHRIIDGHAPSLKGKELALYHALGIQTDHEAITQAEASERIKRGMYVHLREGSQTKNLRDLLPVVTSDNHHRFLFCTDDLHPADIVTHGHINHLVNLAISGGISPIHAIRMATINAATCYGLHDVGAIEVGKTANLIVFDSLTHIVPQAVYYHGKFVKPDLEMPCLQKQDHPHVFETIHLPKGPLDFDYSLSSPLVRVIGLEVNNVTTTHLKERVELVNGHFESDVKHDLLKCCVIERHKASGRIGKAIVKGYGLQSGAMAMSIAHDSHNIITIGVDDVSMQTAIKQLESMGGGIAIAKHHQVLAYLTLEIGGIMTQKDALQVKNTLHHMEDMIRNMGVHPSIQDPFLQLAFLALPVIPKLKLTDYGLFDVEKFQWVSLEWEE